MRKTCWTPQKKPIALATVKESNLFHVRDDSVQHAAIARMTTMTIVKGDDQHTLAMRLASGLDTYEYTAVQKCDAVHS